MMPARRWSCALLTLPLAMLLWPASSHALSSDRNEPIEIEADKAILDAQTQNSVYEGKVYLHQGSLQLRGNRMTLTLRDKHIHQVVIDGTPATFSQRPDHADSDQQAEAAHIEYQTDTRQVLLQGNAVIRQTGREEFRSDRILLNLRDNTVQAGSAGGDNRVHITLQPAKPSGTETAPAPATDGKPQTSPEPASQ